MNNTTQNIIHILDAHTANQIAAGEVVERPFSVVKELVENAIDAGATRIVVHLYDSSCERIRVSDNGCGMSPSDLRMCIQRHATSKISNAGDLHRLSTLGFRGEALPSIASVSVMTIISKLAKGETAYQITVEGGKAGLPEECAGTNGTVVLVDRLFYNAPVRKKFLKSPRTEIGLISDLIGKYAICRPDIAFTLINGNHRAIVTTGDGNLHNAMIAVYGRDALNGMLVLEKDEMVSGLITLPSITRASRNSYSFFINGRIVRSRELSEAVEKGYYTFMPKNRYPIVFLFLQMPMDQVDVNVHPGKLEVKFRDGEKIVSLISDKIQKTLVDYAHGQGTLANPDYNKKSMIGRQQFKPETSEGCRIAAKQVVHAFGEPPQLKGTSLYKALLKKPKGIEKIHHGLMSLDEIDALLKKTEMEPVDTAELPPEIPQPQEIQEPIEQENTMDKESREEKPSMATPFSYSALQILGQFAGTFIIATFGKELHIIDQHAAAERIRYEKLLAEYEKTADDSSLLIVPIQFQTTYRESMLLNDMILKIRDVGFVIEYIAENQFAINGVPLWLGDLDPEDTLRTLLERFDQDAEANPADIRSEEIFMAACRSAVKGNRYLTPADMTALFAQLDQCKNPTTCPHGRPIDCVITLSELYKRFLRGSI